MRQRPLTRSNRPFGPLIVHQPPPLARASKSYPQTDIRRLRRTTHCGRNSRTDALTLRGNDILAALRALISEYSIHRDAYSTSTLFGWYRSIPPKNPLRNGPLNFRKIFGIGLVTSVTAPG